MVTVEESKSVSVTGTKNCKVRGLGRKKDIQQGEDNNQMKDYVKSRSDRICLSNQVVSKVRQIKIIEIEVGKVR